MTDAADQYERYAHDVYAWAYRLVGRHHDALDVTQDVWLRWQAAGERPTNARGWLRRVTLNRAVDLVRARRERSAASETGFEQPAVVDVEARRREVALALDELTEIQRAVVIAKVHDEMTFARIAREHDIAVPTAKTHYLRAVRSLRAALESMKETIDDAR